MPSRGFSCIIISGWLLSQAAAAAAASGDVKRAAEHERPSIREAYSIHRRIQYTILAYTCIHISPPPGRKDDIDVWFWRTARLSCLYVTPSCVSASSSFRHPGGERSIAQVWRALSPPGPLAAGQPGRQRRPPGGPRRHFRAVLCSADQELRAPRLGWTRGWRADFDGKPVSLTRCRGRSRLSRRLWTYICTRLRRTVPGPRVRPSNHIRIRFEEVSDRRKDGRPGGRVSRRQLSNGDGEVEIHASGSGKQKDHLAWPKVRTAHIFHNSL